MHPQPPFVALMRSILGRRHGEKHASAARWPTWQLRQVRAARRLLRGPSAASPCDKRAGRAPRDCNALTKTCRILCCQPILVETSRRSVEIRPIYHYFTKEGVKNGVELNTCCGRRSSSACLRVGAARELSALVAVGPMPYERDCASQKSLSYGARPWCVVPATAYNLCSRLLRGTRERATALAVTREEAQHVSFPRAAAVPGELWSVRTLCQDTATAEILSASLRDRGTTCQLRSPLCAAGFRVTRAYAPLRSLSLTRRRSTRACGVRAPCRAGCDRLVPYERALHRQRASVLRCKTVVRRASCGLHSAQPPFA